MIEEAVVVAEHERSTEASARRWLVLAIASAANFLVILDLWVVSIAYPALQRAFAPTTLAEVSWILNAYAIALATFLVPSGRLADIVGRRTFFLAGLVLFGAASLGCALAPALAALILCRAAQGTAAAMLMPTSLGLALSAFPQQDRGTAVGVWVAVGAVAASSGPVLGGLLVDLSWRWIFLINVPLVLVAVAAGVLHLPADDTRLRRGIDAVGALLVFAATAIACTALVEASAWSPWRTTGALATACVLGTAFVIHVLRRPDPLVSPRLFATRAFRVAVAGIFAYYVGFAAMLLGWTLLLTESWSFSAFHAALAIAPGPIAAGALAPWSGRLSRRLGLRSVVVAGALLFAAAAGWPLATARGGPAYVLVVLPSLLLWGIANAMIQPTLFATADAVRGSELASASAVLTMARQLGSAVGVAGLVAVLGDHHAAGLTGLRRAWLMVIASALVTAVAGLRARGPVHGARTRGPSGAAEA